VSEVGREAAKEIGGRLAASLGMIREDVGREGGAEVGTEDGRPLRACSGSVRVCWALRSVCCRIVSQVC